MERTTPRQTIPEIWTCGITDLEGFERIHTAALRATVIPGRLNANGQAEMWTGSQGQRAPAPLLKAAPARVRSGL